jgi:hypothetical protein
MSYAVCKQFFHSQGDSVGRLTFDAVEVR